MVAVGPCAALYVPSSVFAGLSLLALDLSIAVVVVVRSRDASA